ncbi:hypothetical protein FQN57_007191 [Myotisia sp. PD_48]|nr:hypothetical protein FQN57_007191 [Myotisia sp. PD_48]
MTATLCGPYNSAPDTPSAVFPDRLIRPLPKRRIRSRLSPELAEAILYPPAPPTTQLFYGAYSNSGEVSNNAKVYVQRNLYGYDHSADEDEHHPYEDGVESGEEDGPVVVRRGVGFQRSSLPPTDSKAANFSRHNLSTATKVASNAQDGYEAFENTNNKKKRKIPTSGGLGCHSTLSAEIASLSCGSGTSVSVEDGSGSGSCYGSGNPTSPGGSGVSGPGRGRYGRNASRVSGGRMPLASSHSPNTWPPGRPGMGRRDSAPPLSQEHFEPGKGSDQGIISAAIANAAALSSSAPHGQERVSLLEQSKKPPPAKTQFTFTCESDSSKGMAWQNHSYSLPDHHRSVTQPLGPPLPAHHQRKGFSTQGTQTSPNMAAQTNQQTHTTDQQGQGPQGPPQPRKPRRSARSLYALAARQRRIQQQYTNFHHPPALDDMWICEFCEYESIFGHPPEALIRQYEIKDRKERRRLAEKRRLLEKAKLKGRKGRKATKNAAKQAGVQQNAHPPATERPRQMARREGGIEDDYDEFEEHMPAPRVPQSNPPKQSLPPSSNPHARQQDGGQAGKVPAGGGRGRAG